MAHSSFAARLAYLRWLEGAGRIAPESDAEFARRAGVTYEWLKKWMRRDDAPENRTLSAKLAGVLKVDPAWLLDGAGEAPEPELWKEWATAAKRVAKVEAADVAAPRPSVAKKRRPA